MVGYKLIYGRSRSLFGPYVTKEGKRMLDSPDNYDELLLPNDICLGPGHNAEWIEDDNGDTWMLYHGYLRSKLELQRVVWLDQIKWKDDLPYIENNSPSKTSKAPYFKGVD